MERLPLCKEVIESGEDMEDQDVLEFMENGCGCLKWNGNNVADSFLWNTWQE